MPSSCRSKVASPPQPPPCTKRTIFAGSSAAGCLFLRYSSIPASAAGILNSSLTIERDAGSATLPPAQAIANASKRSWLTQNFTASKRAADRSRCQDGNATKKPPARQMGRGREDDRVLEREAEAEIHPRQNAESVRIRVAQRKALAHQRLEADAELEAAVQRLPAIADDRGAQRRHAGAGGGDAGAARRAARVDGGPAGAQLEDVIARAKAEVAGDDRHRHERRRGARDRAARRGRSRERLVAHADAQAEVGLDAPLIVDGVEKAGAASFEEKGVIGIRLADRWAAIPAAGVAIGQRRHRAESDRNRDRHGPLHIASLELDSIEEAKELPGSEIKRAR